MINIPLYKSNYLKPEWPAPVNVHAFCSTRLGGNSQSPFQHFNVGLHVGDDEQQVIRNRQQLMADINCPESIHWLTQVHGSNVTIIDPDHQQTIEADASISRAAAQVCAIMTADCLPLLICNQAGNEVAAIHAGWRGLLNGVIDNTVKQLNSAPETLLVWLGPAIGPNHFEVNAEIRADFIARNSQFNQAFHLSTQQKWFADIYQLARLNLKQLGITQVFSEELCTYSQSKLFYSYRRDNKITGRMASLIWFIPNAVRI